MLRTVLPLILLVNLQIIQTPEDGQWGNLMEVTIMVETGQITLKMPIKINQDRASVIR
jgi:hypothetical protein